MLPKRLSTAGLEEVYDRLAETLDALPEERRLLFLAKLSLALANLVEDPAEIMAALAAAARELERSPTRRAGQPARGAQLSSSARTALRMKSASGGFGCGLPARWPQMLGIGSSRPRRRCGSSAALSATRK